MVMQITCIAVVMPTIVTGLVIVIVTMVMVVV